MVALLCRLNKRRRRNPLPQFLCSRREMSLFWLRLTAEYSINSSVFLGMFSFSSMRITCLHRAVLNPRWLMKNRLPAPNPVTRNSHCVSTCCHKKDTWNNTFFRKLGNERGVFYFNNKTISPRIYSTSEVKLNCWKCKQPLVKSPTFFCSSCQTIQPPQERTSYFKIMDWLVPYNS